ncbi:hypothetical protein CfE428DRAFT_5446 [Chthoniobacter flavus Ellin428]|uniref:GYF domain-containing protein n=1 Tax=Chthoniobacter flavus Ellin428 TaxID=497964 RepID=B4D956_9BACT|nr:DUF4190 domain-containing protein [Chthoniobacter flavus]EDY17101.1 hypothetical protein CfE428DRAFT_5446 [Chthoniobacter flavus Ellin428]TCO86133.1 uncharacterized protein DUF4339 [Chthoniobacter flavus]
MEIYIARDGNRLGPFPLEEVRRQLASGQLTPNDLAWVQGAQDWVPLASFPPLQSTPPHIPAASSPNLTPTQPTATYAAPSQPGQTSGAAIASLVIGLLSFLLCPIIGSIAAVICGHIARGDIRKSGGRLSGDGMAIAGLVLGYSGFAFIGLAILAGMALPVFGEVQLKGKEVQSLSNAKQIAIACQAYAVDHQNHFPAKLHELVPKYLPDRSVFSSPLSPGETLAYEYFGGLQTDPPQNVLLMSTFKDRHGKRIIVHVDGSGLVGIPPPILPSPLPQ